MSSNGNLSNNLYIKIEKFIKKLSCNLSEDKEIIKDFEDEMKINLESSICELVNDGYDEEKAFKIATKRFGDLREIENELTEVFNTERKFAKILFIGAIMFLLVALGSFTSYKFIDNKFKFIVPEDLKNSIESKIKDNKSVSNEEIDDLLKKYKKQFRYVAIYKEDSFTDIETIISLENLNSEDVKEDESTLGTYVDLEGGEKWRQVRYGFDIKGFYFEIKYILINSSKISFVIYWLLFGIWCTIDGYQKKKLSLVRIILFFTLNIVAYLIFALDRDKISAPKKRQFIA